MQEQKIFCDWITVRQKHSQRHEQFSSGIKTITDPDTGQVIQQSRVPYSLKGENGSNLNISSDGETVRVDGNPSRWNRSENYQGLTLDQVKALTNQILNSVNLPSFTGGKIVQLQDGGQLYTGAIFSRIDLTANVKTGSPQKRDVYLKHQQTQEYPKLEKQLFGKNIYYGKQSESRNIRIYDKALQLTQAILPKIQDADQRQYITSLIDWCNQNGIIRNEVEYRRYLRQKNLRFWHRATSSNLEKQFNKDMKFMSQKIKAPDYGDMPKEVIATLSMYICGHTLYDPKKKKGENILSENTYYKHKKILKEYGYDISNKNVHLLQPKVQIITLEPAGVPDFYRHANPKLGPKAVK